jgi:eukaryotic-like serine/threonine-protein kinase
VAWSVNKSGGLERARHSSYVQCLACGQLCGGVFADTSIGWSNRLGSRRVGVGDGEERVTELSTIAGGRYALAEEIASGGMATVHLGRQMGAGGFARTVAIKRLHERYAKAPEFVAMFLDEARLVARVRHPNVIQTLDVVAEHSELFIVMDFVLGESLVKLMTACQSARLRIPVPIALATLIGVLHGLHEAHEALSESGEPLGIVHRDVSPHNVLIGVDGVARVLDFGVAKASERVQSTHEGQLKGKLSYMAPEQVAGGIVDRRTDIYAAAVVLWEVLTGKKLFSGGNEAQVLNAVMRTAVDPPSALSPDVPPALDAIVMRGLSRDPSLRFATAREMAVALEGAGPTAPASEIGRWVRATCRESVDRRAIAVADIEARTSGSLNEAVDSLRVLSSRGPRRTPSGALPPSPAPSSHPSIGFKEPSTAAVQLSAPPPAPSRGRGLLLGLGATAAFLALVGGVGVYALRASRGGAADASRPPTASASISADAAAATVGATPSAATAPSAPPACPEGMVAIPPGNFFMGSDDDLPMEKPAHRVSLRGFCMDKREVSARAYRACSDRGDCKRAGTANRVAGISAKEKRAYDELCTVADDARLDHPVNCVDWSMADRFCRAAGRRLPTEAEWEFAARGSDGRRYPWGDAAPTSKHLNACGAECVAWGKKRGLSLEAMYADDDGWAGTAPVGSFPLGASPFGVDDVVGNVWEWVADWYGPYGPEDVDGPAGPKGGETRVIRGGGWNGAQPSWVRPTFRYHDAPTTRSHGIGFRCAADVKVTGGG